MDHIQINEILMNHCYGNGQIDSVRLFLLHKCVFILVWNAINGHFHRFMQLLCLQDKALYKCNVRRLIHGNVFKNRKK